MDRYLVRARTYDKDWVEGFLIPLRDGDYQIRVGNENNGFRKTVEPETIGWYTGRRDINGKKIYEKDIVRITFDDNTEEIGAIQWSDYNFRFVFVSPDGGRYGFDRTVNMEVIGNIFDNPELLEG